MADMALTAQRRAVLGKKVARLRRQGITPANIYGHNVASTAIQVNSHDLELLLRRAGRTHLVSISVDGEPGPRSVLVRGIERRPTTGAILHVDFQQVSMREKLTVSVPVILTGHAPITDTADAIVLQNIEALDIECLPSDIPDHIEVDVSGMADTTAVIHVRDVLLPPSLTVLNDPDAAIVSITLRVPTEEEVAAVAEAEAAAEEEAASAPTEAEQE